MGIVDSIFSEALTVDNATCNVVSWSIFFAIIMFVFTCIAVSCESSISTALYNRVLQMEKGRRTFGGIISIVVTSVLFIANTLMAVLSAFVFTPEINYQIILAIFNILAGIIFGLAVLAALVVIAILCFFVLCHMVTVFSRLIYCAKLSSHTPHTLAGYYAANIESWFNKPNKRGNAKLYHLNEELFEKALKDGKLVEKMIKESNKWKESDIEGQTELIKNLTRSMYYAHETKLDAFVLSGSTYSCDVLSKLDISKDDFDFTSTK